MTCCASGATGWRPTCLYRGGCRANEPYLLALHAAAHCLARVCRVWELARSTVYLDQARPTGLVAAARERGPKPRWSDGELVAEIRAVLEVLEASPFLGEGHRKVWARLRWQGV